MCNYDQNSLMERDNTPSVSLGGGDIWGHLSFIRWNLSPLMYFFELWSVKGVLSPTSCLGFLPRAWIKYQQSGQRKSTFGEYLGQVICGCFNTHMHKLFNAFCPFEICPTDSSGQNPWRIGKEEGESGRTKSRDLCLFYFLGCRSLF